MFDKHDRSLPGRVGCRRNGGMGVVAASDGKIHHTQHYSLPAVIAVGYKRPVVRF